MERFDTVVVGGGSAGCVVAAKLADDPRRRVLLLERGQTADENPETLSADGYKDAFINDRVIWERFSTPQEGCLGQRLFMGSGMGLGGSGAVNGMVYLRGGKADFAAWPEGWQWHDVAVDYEGLERELRVRRRPPTRFTEACIAAAEQSGFRRKEDLNDGDLDGAIGYEFMNYEGDQRRSSYASFIAGRVRPNLVVETEARAHRVRLTPERRVAGVEYERAGTLCFAEAERVVLCAGALETPKLLMLSGLGPGDNLREHGVPVVLDLPAIGSNFHDHPNVTLFFLGRQPVDCCYPQLYGFHRANPKSRLPAGQPDTCYVFYPARSSLKEAAQRMLPGMLLPPREDGARGKRVIRGAVELAFRSSALRRFVERVWGIVLILGKPQSRGKVRLQSGAANRQAFIDPAYFSDPQDITTMVEGVSYAQRIAGAPALAEWGNRRLGPPPAASENPDLHDWIRKHTMTTYHFAGTCRMGTDPASVVDTRLHVRGVTGLWVADASVISELPVSAINAPSMLVGYRVARFIDEETRAASGT